MRMLLLLLLFASAANFAGCWAQTVEGGAPKTIAVNAGKLPVLVELFTSEGCSSCPPAEQALAFLTEQQPVANAEVIALAFHVDYWNGLGWKDVYAAPLFTQRQQIYARSLKVYSIYTPQMVVDGHSEFIGSDLGKANKAIAKAVTISKGRAAVLISANKISVTIVGLPNHKDATVYLVVAENGLSTNVGGGENQGRNLQHSSVVRELRTLGGVGIEEADFEASTGLDLSPEWKRENLSLVVFVQENAGRKILAVGRAKLN